MKYLDLKYLYKLSDAWTQYFNESIIRDDIVRSEIIQMWHRSKISNHDPNATSIDIADFSEPKLKTEFIDKLFQKNVNSLASNVYIIDSDGYIVDSVENFDSPYCFRNGYSLKSAKIAPSAYHMQLELQTDEYELCGAEHFYKVLHDYYEYALTVTINNLEYVFLYLVKLESLNEEFCDKLKELTYSLKERTDIPEVVTPPENVKSVLVVNLLSYVIDVISNDNLFQKADMLVEHFEKLSIEKIKAQNLQVLKSKKNNQVYLLESLTKIGRNYLISITSLEEKLKLFKKINKPQIYSVDKINNITFNKIQKRRLNALINSSSDIIMVNSSEFNLYDVFLKEQMTINKKNVLPIDVGQNLDILDDIIFYMQNKSEVTYFDLYQDSIFYLYSLEVVPCETIIDIFSAIEAKNVRENSFVIELNLAQYNKIDDKISSLLEKLDLQTIKVKLTYDYNNNTAKSTLKDTEVNNKLKVLNLEKTSSNSKITEKIDNLDKLQAGNGKEDYDIKNLEKNTILSAIIESNRNMSLTAEMLGISRSTLYRKIKKYQIKL